MTSAADKPTADDPPRRPRRALPWWAWILAMVVIFAASVLGVRVAPPGSQVAVWWPAAGLSVLFVLLAPSGRERAWALGAIFVSTALANAVGGRPISVASAFAVANTVEALVVFAVLRFLGGRDFRLRTLDAAIRFTVAVLAGAEAIGALAGAAVAVLEGGQFFSTVAFVAASHSAAVFMIAPFGLLSPRIPVRATVEEMVVQAVILAGVIVLVFDSAAHLPLAFLPFPVLAWAAFRFPLRVVLVETLLASMAILAFTVAGAGPFNGTGLGFSQEAALAETFLVTFTGFTVVLAAAQYELRATSRELVQASRLLSGSLVEASVGLLIAKRSRDGSLRVVWSNPTAAALLPPTSGRRWEGELAEAARSALGGAITLSSDTRTLTVAANRIPDEPDRFAVQLVDVTDTLRAQAAALAAEREREAARSTRLDLERQREDFVATTSHELRTPITSIVGFCELLADSDALGPLERSWVEVIDRNAVRLASLVEDLLTLGGGSGRPVVPDAADTDMEAQIRDVISAASVLAAKKGIDLTYTGHGGSARADPRDVNRILTNLVANAIKFTPEGGRVTVATSSTDTTITVEVADTGPGMSEETLGQAFDRFYRGPGMERDAVPGTGLGLAIVAELVERNGGSVSLASPPTGGTRASVQLQKLVTARVE